MKRLISGFLVLIFFMAILPARSQWIPCQGIEGAGTEDIILYDSDLYIINSGSGIFKKNIHSTSWDSACVAGGFSKIRSTDDAVFCCGPMADFLRSMDNGTSWEIMDFNGGVLDMETIDQYIFVSDNGPLLRSSDNGETWTTLYPYSDSINVRGIYAQEGLLFCEMNFVDSIFRSDDYGESWTPFPLTGMEGDIRDIFAFNEKLWLGSSKGAYLYDNNAFTWSKIQDSLPENSYVNSFYEDSGILYCCTNHGFFGFNAQDSIWVDNSEGLENRACWAACRMGNTIYLATSNGPFSKSESEDWRPEYDDLFGIPVTQVFIAGSRTYALAKGIIYYSDDITNGFDILNSQGYCPAYKIIATDSGWFAASACGFLVSFDSGQSWTAQNAGVEGKPMHDIALTDKYYFAVLNEWGSPFFRTRVDSIAWEKVPNELVSMNVGDIAAINNVLFAATDSLYRSLDYGITFEATLDAGDDFAIFFAEYDKIFILRYYENVLYSDNYGLSWQIFIENLGSPYIYCMDITKTLETTVLGGFVGPWEPLNYLIIYSPDHPYGEDITENLPDYRWSSISQVLFDNGRIFVCPSSGGLWYRDDLMVGMKDDDFSKKEPYNSLFLFPNPVNDVLTIDLQEFGDQSEYLIFDQLGRMIKRDLCERGNSQATIDVSRFPQGIYFIVIRDSQGVSRAGKFVKVD
jgi:photosystem II stability/assembly factor-like uncharacterized protein